MDRLTDFIASYAEAWNSRDLDRIVGAYATPCFVVKGGQVLRHRDEPAKRRYFGELLAGNQREGPHTWSVSDLDPRPLGRDAAMVTVRWVCHRPDGSVLWEFLDSYLLAADEGHWHILGDVVHT
jgi:ketosteroid isomerase-like protein